MIWALARPFAPHAAMALLLGLAVWLIHHDGAVRARRDAERRQAALTARMQSELRRSEVRLALRLNAIDSTLGGQRAAIAQTRTVIQPALVKELTRETRYADPAAGISDELRSAIDRARAAVTCASAADGGILCTVPAASPAERQ